MHAALLREQGLAHLLEPTEEGRPIVLGLREHLLDRLVVRNALRELADVAVQRVARGEPCARKRVAAGDEGRLEVRLLLTQQFDNLRLSILEIRVGEQRVREREHIARLVHRRLATHCQVGDKVEGVRHGAAWTGRLLVDHRS